MWLAFFVKFILALVAIIVIILVMLQRGKGGGLAGALGGMGGQSAFGTKAGDLFTKITIVVASVWILICVLTAVNAKHLGGETFEVTQNPSAQQPMSETPPSKPADSGAGKPDKSGKSAMPSTTDKGAKDTSPAAKPADKSPDKPASSTPTAPAK
jgi:preprotein translocase subunit SecG